MKQVIVDSSPHSTIFANTVYGLPICRIEEEKLTNLSQHTKLPSSCIIVPKEY